SENKTQEPAKAPDDDANGVVTGEDSSGVAPIKADGKTEGKTDVPADVKSSPNGAAGHADAKAIDAKASDAKAGQAKKKDAAKEVALLAPGNALRWVR